MSEQEKKDNLTSKVTTAMVAIFVTVASASIIAWAGFIFTNVLDAKELTIKTNAKLEIINRTLVEEVSELRRQYEIETERNKEMREFYESLFAPTAAGIEEDNDIDPDIPPEPVPEPEPIAVPEPDDRDREYQERIYQEQQQQIERWTPHVK